MKYLMMLVLAVSLLKSCNQPTPLTITTTTAPVAVLDASYSLALTATGGTPPYSWDVTQGFLPAGLGLDSQTGVISGVPNALGSASFTVTVTDSSGGKQTITMRLYSIQERKHEDSDTLADTEFGIDNWFSHASISANKSNSVTFIDDYSSSWLVHCYNDHAGSGRRTGIHSNDSSCRRNRSVLMEGDHRDWPNWPTIRLDIGHDTNWLDDNDIGHASNVDLYRHESMQL